MPRAHRGARAGPRIPGDPRLTLANSEGAEAADLDPFTACECGTEVIEQCLHDDLDVAVAETRLPLGKTVDQFGSVHGYNLDRATHGNPKTEARSMQLALTRTDGNEAQGTKDDTDALASTHCHDGSAGFLL